MTDIKGKDTIPPSQNMFSASFFNSTDVKMSHIADTYPRAYWNMVKKL
jgi:hypothetical protein